MIGRLSTTITAVKEFVFRHTLLRALCYWGIALALLLFWLYSDSGEVAFVYNNF